MFETGSAGSAVVSRVTDVLEQLAVAQQELLGLDATALSRDELLDLVEVLEINARRQTAVGCALIAELARPRGGRRAGLPVHWGAPGRATADWPAGGRRPGSGGLRPGAATGRYWRDSGAAIPARRRSAGGGDDLCSTRRGYHRHGRPAARPGAHGAAGVGCPGRTNPGRPCAETRSGSARGAGPHRGDLSGPGRAAGRRAGPPAAPICRLGGSAEWLR